MCALVLFDVDGTLCDTCEVDEECFLRAVGEALALPLQGEDWTSAPHVTDAGILAWMWRRHRGGEPTEAEVGRVIARFVNLLHEAHQARPGRFAAMSGAARAVATLPHRGFDVAAATGGWRQPALMKLRAAHLPSRILLASSTESQDRAEVFHLAAERAHAEAENVVLVGDGVWDLRVSQELGWAFVGVASGARAGQLANAGAHVVVPDFRDLRAFETAIAASRREKGERKRFPGRQAVERSRQEESTRGGGESG